MKTIRPSFKSFKEKALENPEIKAEYEALVAGDTTLDANVYYSNTKGSTWGVKLPVGTRHAYERVPFREAYPDFTKWVDSKGASNQKWYENFVDEKTIRYW